MGILSVSIPDELDEEFREIITRKFGGYRKGIIRKGVIEALEDWISKNGVGNLGH